MKTVEVSGRTVEEAVHAAAEQLGVAVDAVAYEVVEEGGKGFLGLGQAPTMIRAHVRDDYEPGEEPAAVQEEVVEEERVEEKVEEEATPAPAEVVVPAPIAEEAAVPTPAAAEAGPLSNAVMRMLDEVLKAMGLDAKPVLKSESGEEVEVELVGKDVAILIGTRGQTLDALQYLISIGANKGLSDRRRVIVDAEGYRARHKEMLESQAREYAQAVKAQRQEAVLDPQSARDRRIIHLALADDPDVHTYSEGAGDTRHVVISPKK